MSSTGGLGGPSDTHWGPGIGSGGAAVNELESVDDAGVIRIRGGGYDSDEDVDVNTPEAVVMRIRGGGYDADEDTDVDTPQGAVMRIRGGGFNTGGELGKEEAAAEKVLEAGAKNSKGSSVFQAQNDDDNDDDDTDYDHGLKGVGTGKEPAEAHGVNTKETGKVKAPGLAGRIKEEFQAFTGLFSAKKTEK